MNLNIFNHSNFDQYAAYLKASGLSDASIKRKLSSLTNFQKYLVKKNLIQSNPPAPTFVVSPSMPAGRHGLEKGELIKKNFNPNPALGRVIKKFPSLREGLGVGFQNLQNKKLFSYLLIASLLIISSAIGYGFYRQSLKDAKSGFAYSTASSPVYANRFLSFQGRLTDSSGNPITSSVSIRFDLFNTEAIGTGTSLYSSATGNSQVVVPDENGIFSVTIGKTHGTEIPNSVFTENPAVYLQITAGSETMSPRQPIATVAYAINAETLQGLPPSASGLKDTVLTVDSSGNLNLGETSPTIKSTSGTLGIEGQAVLIKASDGSGGNIEINPDANGIIKLTTEGSGSTAVNGFIDATNANLATGNLYSATIRNDNRGYNFLNFRNYDAGTTQLTTRFSIDASGNTLIGGTLSPTNISINNTLLTSSASELNLLDGTLATAGSVIYGNGSNLVNTAVGTSGQILMSNATGAPVWINANTTGIGTTYSATNGLTLSSNTFKLGGALTENTNLTIGSTSAFFINATSGSIGLGTISPGSKLDIQTTGYGLPALSGTNQTYGGLRISPPGSSGNMVMDMGIASSSNGAWIQATLRTNLSSTYSLLLNPNGGNVGIGTTSPSQKLDVNGKIAINGQQTIYNAGALSSNFTGSLFIGNGGNNLSHSSGDQGYYNTGIGMYALGVISTGDRNTGIGTYALSSTSTGSKNTAQGYTSMSSNTSGYNNTALGAYSLQYNTTGSINTAVGYGALSLNKTGSNGLAIGYQSQYYTNDTTTAWVNYNTSIGYQALMGSTTPATNTGNYNTAIGYQSLYSNTSGEKNTATGYNALLSNTTGKHNSAQGYMALQSNTTGNYNTAQGYVALYNLTGDYSYNTALGYNAGRYYNGTTGNLTSASQSLFLGASASALADGDSNETVIGYGAIGNGSNSVTLGNDSITKTILKGNVGIGTTSPSHKLEVVGNGSFSTNLSVGGTLTFSQGAANNYLFVSDTSGNGRWADPNSLGIGVTYAAGNGLTLSSNTFKLGGALTENTRLNIGNTEVFYAQYSSGNVGIGTTNPTYKLQIEGNASIAGDLNMNNFYINNGYQPGNSNFLGYQAGDNASSSSYSNFFGQYTGQNASYTQDSNFFGRYTGQNASYTSNSNFIGQSAGKDAPYASNSNFFGYYAGIGATGAQYSNFFGRYTGQNASYANYSNFLGYNSGNNASNTSNSNFFGQDAGNGASNSYNSNFIGQSAGVGASSTTYSNFIGNNAGGYAAGSSYSTFIGHYSGYNTKNAQNSTFIGNFAGYGTTNNASNAIFIGNFAGYQDAVDTGSTATAIAIGRYAGTGGYKNSIAIGHGVINSAENQVNFGNILYMTGLAGSDTRSSSPLVNSKVGIGTTNPTSKLHVIGDGIFSGNLTIGGTFVSVGSTNLVTNLNADLLDGYHATDFASVTDGIYYIEGTGTTAGTWLGSNAKISSYYDGLTIRYYTPIAGASTTTLDINGFGAKTIYLYESTKLTTHYPAFSVITLTYSSTKNGGSWFVEPYYADGSESYTVRWNASVKNNSTDINHGYKLTFEKPDGTFAPVSVGNGAVANSSTISSQTFKLGGQTLYYGSSTDIAANGTYSNVYEGITSSEMEYWNNRGTTAWATAGLPFYLVGIPSDDGDTFTLVGSGTTNALGTQTLPTTEDGLIYIQIGFMNNTTDSWRLSTEHPIFEFKNGVLREYMPKKNKMDSLFVMNNVGIGTTNPLQKLSVIGNGSFSTSLNVGTTLTATTVNFTNSQSTTKVTNLNADLLDGLDSTQFLQIGSSANFISNLTAGNGISVAGSGIGRTITNTGIIDATNTTLTRAGSAGSYTLGLNLSNANTWTGTQTFNNISVGGTLTTSSFIRIASAGTVDGASPGLSLSPGDDFLYDGKYLNHYGLGFHTTGIGTSGPGAYLSGYFGINLFTGGQNRLNITYAGNVGIGTTNPTHKLEVVGDGSFSTNLTVGSTLSVTGKSIFTAGFDSNAASTISSLTLDGNSGTALNISGTSFTTDINLQNGETIDNDTDGRINFSSSNLSLGSTTFLTSGRLLQVADGTVSAPSISFSSDTNTGIYSNAADILKFTTAGADRLTINASGNVGIGTTNPSQKLSITGNLNLTGQLQLGNLSADPTAIGNGSLYYNTSSKTVNFFNGTDWLQLAANSFFTNSGTLANGEYIDVIHNQNTNDLIASGWVYDTVTSTWKQFDGTSEENQTVDLMEYTSDTNAQTAYQTSDPAIAATGGTITYSGGYTIHTFTSSSTFTPTGSGEVEVLVVGGGGGGGTDIGGGGGGGGGVVYNSSYSVNGATTVTVGNGGSAHTNGANSIFGSLTATGGGRGGTYSGSGTYENGASGGSGGGGSMGYPYTAGSGGAGTSGQGNNGGNGYVSGTPGAGGGGGAGAAGSNGALYQGGNGGIGQAYSISGTSTYYGGGGGGGGYTGTSGTGGLGGGATAGSNGTANTGGGGGGHSGSGGSGIVIVRYLTTPPLQSYSESTIKQEGSYALKGVAAATASLNQTLTRTISPTLNLSNQNKLSFDLRASRTGQNIKIGLRDAGGYTTEITPNITSANVYQTFELDISGIANANKDAIDQIIITIVNADADNTFYLDNITTVNDYRITQIDSNTVRLYNYSGETKTLKLNVVTKDSALSGGGSSSGVWSDLLNPTADLSLNMSNYSTKFNWSGGGLFTLDSNGKVGIGTTSPLTPLHVGTTATATVGGQNLSGLSGILTGSIATPRLYDSDNSQYFIDPAVNDINYNSLGLASQGSIKFNVNDSAGIAKYWAATAASRIQGFANGLSLDVGTLASIGVGNTVVWNNNLFLATSGYVGIGTTSPTSKLSIGGASSLISNASGDITINSASNNISFAGDSLININNAYFAGNVGIGTTNPGYTLDVNGTIRATSSNTSNTSLLIANTSTNGRTYGWYASGTSGGVAPAGSLTLWDTAVGPRMTISNTGFIGIGTTNPSYKLEVTGNIVNTAPLNGYIALSGNLPGYSANLYPTIKTNGANLYFSVNGAYSAYIDSGGGYHSVSDRERKENFTSIDPQDILTKINQLPMTKWNYKGQDSRITHIAPIAQDFAEIFQLDPTDTKTISNIDPSGIALVGIQALSQNINILNNDLSLTTTGQISINYNVSESILVSLGYNGTKNEIESATYNLTNSMGNTVTRIAQFGQIAVAKIKAGLVSTTSLLADNAAIKNLKTKKIESDEIISPIANIENINSETINTQYLTSSMLTSQEATVSTLIAQNIQTTEITADTINTQELSSLRSTINDLRSDTATVSTLYADQIISKEGSFADIMANKISSLRDELTNIVAKNEESTPSAIALESDNWSINVATDSATISGNLALTDNLIIGAQLLVNGDAQFGNAFVTGQFTAGEVSIASNYIETSNTALFIQPSNTGSVHIMGETLVIADTGEVKINGNLTVTGSVFANLLEANEIKTQKLTAAEINSDKINIATDLSALSAEALAQADETSTNISTDSGMIIADNNNINIATNSAQVNSNATAGTATLPIGKTELIISTTKLSANSMVYLTPMGSTNNQVLYVKEKTADHFTIGLDQALDHDININWWIIN